MSDIVDAPAEDPFDAIVDAPFDAALSERYLIYAMSTITARISYTRWQDQALTDASPITDAGARA